MDEPSGADNLAQHYGKDYYSKLLDIKDAPWEDQILLDVDTFPGTSSTQRSVGTVSASYFACCALTVCLDQTWATAKGSLLWLDFCALTFWKRTATGF